MIRSLYTGATGMQAQQLNIDNISNNLANVNTIGFKKAEIQFQDLIYQTLTEAGSATSYGINTPTELTVGVGVKPISSQKSFSQGTLNATGNPLDMAVNGDGFFKVVNGEGEIFYTRDGSFKLNKDGRLVNANGYFLDPEISFPADTEEVQISKDGIVFAKIYGSVETEEIGQLELAGFVNPAGLKSLGGNLFAETSASGEAIAGTPGSERFGTIEQGYTEASNVSVVQEMVKMISAQRAYDLNSKSVKTAGEMIQTALGLKR
ncbi:MAG: flagellar basal-body rod protein FlgG [Candidatus Cloacimonadota bacterium]|nr:MAG: flagellar basal-body rod protein FlgG [Candidatus Cloacimonadota bacterium]